MKLTFLLSPLLAFACYAPSPLFFAQNGASAAATGFNPADYGPVALWSGARYETRFANNDSVDSLADFSGNGRTASQPTIGARPIWKAAGTVSGINIPVTYHDGGDFLATIGLVIPQPYTIGIVARSATAGAVNSVIGSGAGYTGISARNNGQWLSYAGVLSLYHGTTTNWTTAVAVFDGASSFVYDNGTKTTGDTGSYQLYGGIVLGAWNGGAEAFNGHVAIWVVWSDRLTDAQAAAACQKMREDSGL